MIFLQSIILRVKNHELDLLIEKFNHAHHGQKLYGGWFIAWLLLLLFIIIIYEPTAGAAPKHTYTYISQLCVVECSSGQDSVDCGFRLKEVGLKKKKKENWWHFYGKFHSKLKVELIAEKRQREM